MKIGIIGAGGIARHMAKTLNQMQGVTCYAIASRTLEKAQEFAKIHQIENAYGSYEELVKDEQVDLVYIATPHNYHYEQALLCLEHNKPVLCEKAFMLNAKQAKEVICKAEEKNVFVAEAIWTRYLPSRTLVQEVIDSGEIGEITTITANFGAKIQHIQRITDPSLAGGVLLDLGVYLMAFATMFLGTEVEEVQSVCTKFDTGVDATNSIILKYKDEKQVLLHSNATAVTDKKGIIYGTKGYIVANDFNNITSIDVYEGETLKRSIEIPAQITGFEYQVEAAIAAIKEGKIECAQAPHEVSIRVMELMDECRKQWGLVYPDE